MAFTTTGTKETQYLSYDSGTVTFDGKQVIDVTGITLSQSFARKSFRALNSRFEIGLRRGEYEGSLSFSTHSGSENLFKAFYGSSSTVSASEVDFETKDGNQEAKTLILTVYYNEDTTKGEQYTLDNPVILSLNRATNTDEFGSFEVEIAFTKISKFKRIT